MGNQVHFSSAFPCFSSLLAALTEKRGYNYEFLLLSVAEKWVLRLTLEQTEQMPRFYCPTIQLASSFQGILNTFIYKL